mmetsp:Transcript_23598/g.49160  ORF Transcript_23598/g.49160 Transcript_23598/m.49160 type:complete len:101 (+) Transcript_23598:179-481(+)
MRIVNAILAKVDNVHVQLEHNTVETTWEKHGEIELRLTLADGSEDAEKILYDQDYQHNRNYSSMTTKAEEIAAEVEEFLLSCNKKRGESGETASLTDNEK